MSIKSEAVTERLLASGAISRQALERAQRAAEESGSRVDQALNRLGLVSDDLIIQTWSSVTGIASVSAAGLPEALPCANSLLPAFLRDARCAPLRVTNGILILAIEDPLDNFTPAAVAARTGLEIELRLVRAGDLDAWLKSLPDDTLQAAAPAAWASSRASMTIAAFGGHPSPYRLLRGGIPLGRPTRQPVHGNGYGAGRRRQRIQGPRAPG